MSNLSPVFPAEEMILGDAVSMSMNDLCSLIYSSKQLCKIYRCKMVYILEYIRNELFIPIILRTPKTM